VLSYSFFEFVFLDDDRVNPERRLKFNVIDCLKIGWIGDAEKQSLATFDQRQYAMLVDQLLVDRA